MVEHLLHVYIEHGPPEILKSDQGPEFKGVVKLFKRTCMDLKDESTLIKDLVLLPC